MLVQSVPVVQRVINSCRKTRILSTNLCGEVELESDFSQLSIAECKGYHATRAYRNHLNQEIHIDIDMKTIDEYYQLEN